MRWLTDLPAVIVYGPAVIGILLAAAAFFLVSPPKQTRERDPKEKPASPRRILFVFAAVAFLLTIALSIPGMLGESDSKQIERKLHEMSKAVSERDADKIMRHVSESFRVQSSDKKALRSKAAEALHSGQLTEIPIWDVLVDPIPEGATTAKARLRFKVKGSAFNENQFIAKATFVRDSDREWRLQSFEVFLPPNERDPVPMPGL